MTYSPKLRSLPRAPRIALRGSVSAILHLESRRHFNARLQQLSITGGLLEVASYIDERSKISLAIEIGPTPLLAWGELLFPMRGGMGYLQPFRFTGFGAGVRQTLEIEIARRLKQTAVPVPPAPPSGHGSGLRLPRFFLLDSF